MRLWILPLSGESNTELIVILSFVFLGFGERMGMVGGEGQEKPKLSNEMRQDSTDAHNEIRKPKSISSS